MDTNAHTRKPHASRASTRQIATRTHVDSRDLDAHARKGETKKDGWGQKVYPRGSYGTRRVEGHECDSGRARAALLRMERETTLPRSSTRRRTTPLVSSESSGGSSARVSGTSSSSPPAPHSPSHRAILPRSLTRVPAMFVLEARANAELAAEARRVSAAWAKVKSTVATNRADAARRLTLLAAKDAERGESLFLSSYRQLV